MQCDEIHDKMTAYINCLKSAQENILNSGTLPREGKSAVKLKQQESGKGLTKKATASEPRKETTLEPASRKYILVQH